MRKSIFVSVSAAMALTLMPATAQPTKPATPTTKSGQANPSTAEFDKQAAQLQENINKMHEQMSKIQKTPDPQERQRLMQEHWMTMQNSMGMMHGMGGGRMMRGDGMRSGMGSGMGHGMMG